VEYAFLADFDLLSDTRSDVRLKIWAKPASRVLMDQYFKMERAREEITRLNVEIPRLTTYIRDEEAFLLQHEQSLQESNLPLSRQLSLRRLRLIRSNDLHIHWLEKLATFPGFSGTIAPGTALDVTQQPENFTQRTPQEYTGREEEEEEEEEEERDQAAAEAVDAFCLIIE
jgi:hypothetical protein